MWARATASKSVSSKPLASKPGAPEAVASTVQRLGVLLAAGVTPVSAWGYLAEAPDASPPLIEVAAAGAAGTPLADAVFESSARLGGSEVQAWRGLASAWFVAGEVGAPLAPTLAAFAAALRDLAQGERDRAVALAGPRATARMVLALPAVGLVFGLALGFDTLGILFTTPLGLLCLVAGVALMMLARAWNRRLLRGAEPTGATPGLTLDLMAIAVSGGASIDRALAVMREAERRFGGETERLGGGVATDVELDVDFGTDAAAGVEARPRGRARSTREGAAIEAVLALSRRAGVPAAALLKAEAEEARREARSEGERVAATLSVTLMLPLGLCILPAFMLLGVAPLMLAVVTATVGAV